MQIGDFDFYHEFLEERCGLTLREDQTYILQSRLGPISKQWGFETIEDMTISLRALPDVTLIAAIIGAMSNTETAFFRDHKPFLYLEEKALPELGHKKNIFKPLRIWSAGCASGQEAYSLAMICARSRKHLKTMIGSPAYTIWATDVCETALHQAHKGHYTQSEVQNGLPSSYMMKFCKQKDQGWSIADKIKKTITFEEHNLLDTVIQPASFSVIFCRYVLGSMSSRACNFILERFAALLPKDGYLFLGTQENIQNTILDEMFGAVPHHTGIYKRL